MADFDDDSQDPKHPTPVERAWRNLMRTEDGHLIFADLMRACGVLDGAFTGNSTTFFNLGRQQVGMHVLRRMAGQNLTTDAALTKWLAFLAEEANG